MDGFKLVDDTQETLLNYYINSILSSNKDINGNIFFNDCNNFLDSL